MKRKISICFFMFTALVFVGSTLLLKWQEDKEEQMRKAGEEVSSEQKAEEAEPAEKVLLSESMARTGAAYYLAVEDGYVVVLERDRKTVYFETNILYQSLPEILKRQLAAGISFPGEAELYDFLESYSS